MNLTKEEKKKIFELKIQIDTITARLQNIVVMLEIDKIMKPKLKERMSFDEVVNICELPGYKNRFFICKKDAYSNLTNTHVLEGDGSCPITCKNSLRKFKKKRVKIF